MSEEIRFAVDASLIDRLGKELVAKQETALSELIKNAYDADATQVDIDFVEESYGKVTAIIIKDNGIGMSKNDLINKFFRISADNKIKDPFSARFKRKCAGRKGIGRFSAQRLGKKMTLITKNKNKIHKIVVDWTIFKNVDLGEIPITIDQLKEINESNFDLKLEIKEGTIFIIEDLNDFWTESQQLRVYRYVSSIIQPFPYSEFPYSDLKFTMVKNKKDQTINDPGFNVSMYLKTPEKRSVIADQEESIFKHAVASIDIIITPENLSTTIESAYFKFRKKNKKGQNFLEHIKKLIKNKKNLLIYDEREEAYRVYRLNAFKDIHVKVFFFLKKNKYIPKKMMGTIKNLLNNYGGVRVYRNGFRVLPYGEPDDDWLSLDEKISSYTDISSIGNNNVLGYVLIDDPDSEFFDETSSREGLINIPEFTLLQYIIRNELLDSLREIINANINSTKNTKPEDIFEARKRKEDIETLLTILNEFKQKTESADKDDIEEAIAIVENVNKIFTEQIDEIEMLRVLAGLGLAIGQFVHEIGNRLHDFNSLSKNILDTILDSDIKKQVNILIDRVSSFQTYTSYFEGVIRSNIRRDKKVLSLNSVARKFWNIIKGDTIEQGITFPEPTGEGYFFYITPMHESEWSSILFNLYTNSKKAIIKSNSKNKIINIFLCRAGNYIIMDFLDTGVGIPEENKDKIFQPFFTTTSFVDETDYQGIKGMGLGLKIVKDIIVSYKGRIYAAKPEKGFTTCIRIEIPIAKKEEIERYELS